MTPYIFPGLKSETKNIITNTFLFGRSRVILNSVCETLMIDNQSLLSKSRLRPNVEARQIIIGMIKVEENLFISLKDVGKVLGGLDHSTIIYSIKTYNNLLETDPRFKNKVNLVKSKLYGH